MEWGDRGPSPDVGVEGIEAKGGKVLPGKEEFTPGIASPGSCDIPECIDLSLDTMRGAMGVSNGLEATVEGRNGGPL